MQNSKQILITGGAGFIGFHLSKLFAEQNKNIIIIDNINDYYDINLKYARLKILGVEQSYIQDNKRIRSSKYHNLTFVKADISDLENLNKIFEENNIEFIINLAAQAGVRYSIENPQAYMQSNIVGFFNIAEMARKNKIQKVIYASSSSVYGNNAQTPFSEKHCTTQPESFYAATKVSNELTAHTYSKIYGINFIGLRFFTVYGALGRPDMAYFKFANSISKNETIKIYNNGELYRDFTYIDDIIKSIEIIYHKFSEQKQEKFHAEIFNIGGGQKVKLSNFIEYLEEALGKIAKKEYVGMQKGDVFETNADASKLENYTGFKPKVNIKEGLKIFAKWYNLYN